RKSLVARPCLLSCEHGGFRIPPSEKPILFRLRCQGRVQLRRARPHHSSRGRRVEAQRPPSRQSVAAVFAIDRCSCGRAQGRHWITLSRKHSMVTVTVEDDRVRFEVEGWDKLWAFKSQLEIPIAHIESVRLDPEAARGWWHGLRLPGTQIPGLITAGTFFQS